MKKRLFTYAVILHKKKEDNNKAIEQFDSVVIIEPTTVLAKDHNDVAFKVTRLIPEEHAEDPDNVEILIRPF
jgi:hypothetical protein